jgi:hypothetical protein
VSEGVVTALIGLGGVALGALISTFLHRRIEHRQWHRDARLDAYVTFLNAYSRFFLPERDADDRLLTGDLDPLADAFDKLLLVASDDAAEAAHGLFGLALEREADPDLHWELIHAARRDLGVPKLWGGALWMLTDRRPR